MQDTHIPSGGGLVLKLYLIKLKLLPKGYVQEIKFTIVGAAHLNT